MIKGFSIIIPLFILFLLSSVATVLMESSLSLYKIKRRSLDNFLFEESVRSHFLFTINTLVEKINHRRFKDKKDFEELFGELKATEFYGETSENYWEIVEFKVENFTSYALFYLRVRLKKIFKTAFFGIKNYSRTVEFSMSVASGKLPVQYFALSANEIYGDGIRTVLFYPYHSVDIPEVPVFIDVKEELAEIFGVERKDINEALIKRLLSKEPEVPIINGVYVGKSGDKAFLYIKGDLQKVVVNGRENSFITIKVLLDENLNEIDYSIKEHVLYVKTQETDVKYNAEFSGLILVDGNINSLLSETGFSVPEGFELRFIVGGKVEVDSSIKYENVSIKKKKFKREKAKFLLESVSESLFGIEEVESGITIFNADEIMGDFLTDGEINILSELSFFGSLSGDEINAVLNLTVYEDPLNFSKHYSERKTLKDKTVILKIKFLSEEL